MLKIYKLKNIIIFIFIFVQMMASDISCQNCSVCKYLDSCRKQLVLNAIKEHGIVPNRKIRVSFKYEKLEQTNDLFQSIFDRLINKDVMYYNPEIKYRFFTICNSITQNMKLRDLRAIRKKVSKFNKYLKFYKANMTKYLKLFDIQLIDDLQLLNFNLLAYHLDSEFLNVTFGDKMADCFFRGKEWVGGHPVITTAVILTAIGFIIFYKYQKNKNWKKLEQEKESRQQLNDAGCEKRKFKIINTSKYKKNNNNYDVIQLSTLHQHGEQCGPTSVNNVKCMLLAINRQEAEELLKNQNNLNQSLNNAMRIVGKIDNLETIDIQNLVDSLPRNLKDNIVVLDFATGRDIRRNKYYKRGAVEKFNNATIMENPDICAAIREFRENVISKGVIIRSGDHWIAAKIIKDGQSDDEVKVWVANSMPCNVTRDRYLNQAINLFVNKDIPTSEMIDIKNELVMAENYLNRSEDSGGADPVKSLKYFNLACERFKQISHEDRQKESCKNLNSRMFSIFEYLKEKHKEVAGNLGDVSFDDYLENR